MILTLDQMGTLEYEISALMERMRFQQRQGDARGASDTWDQAVWLLLVLRRLGLLDGEQFNSVYHGMHHFR